MNRPHSRGELRKRAMLAFARRNRVPVESRNGPGRPLRAPEGDETPLSMAEVRHGQKNGLIAGFPEFCNSEGVH